MVAFDGSSRVPLVFASPRFAALGAKTVAQPATLIDIFPTLLTMAGAAVPSFADGFDLSPFFQAGVERDCARPPFVAFQNHDEDISSSWFAVMNGTHKLVQYGAGDLVVPELFDLVADPGEFRNLVNTSDAARAAVASLDAQLRSIIPYPEVAQDVAQYQLDQFKYWISQQSDWKKEIASANVRWQSAFLAHEAESFAALDAFLAQTAATIRPCDGRTGNIAP